MSDDRDTTTRGARQVKYGLNVFVAVAAVVTLVVLVNWLAHERLYARLDWTATRQYSLSEQTRQVLGALEGEYQVVTIFRDTGPRITQVRDLVDEYARQGRGVTAEHINPDFDLGRREALDRRVRAHFADEVEPIRQAVTDGRDALAGYSQGLGTFIEPLASLMEGESLPAGTTLRQRVQAVLAELRIHESSAPEQMAGLNEALDQALPDYVAVRDYLVGELADLDERVLSPALNWFDRAAEDRQASNDAKEALLRLRRQLEPARQGLRDAVRELRLAHHPAHYDEMLAELKQGQSVLVLGPGQVRVIGGGEMYRDVDPRIARQTGQPEMRFLGEERLTGALISMSLEQPPLVVFVMGERPALGERGQYQQVAQRLRSASFELKQWNPAGQAAPQQMTMGQAQPTREAPEGPPEPAEGQRAIWVVLPQPAVDRYGQANPARELVAGHLERRLAAGDTAMVMLATEPGLMMEGVDPLIGVLREWGIRPQLDRIVLREVQAPGQEARASSQIEVDAWPGASPITRALAGMPAVIPSANPLVLTADGELGRDAKHAPLVELRGDRLWAERHLESLEAIQQAPFDSGAARESFTIAASAQHEAGGRLVVVADPAWATDAVTGYGWMGPGTAELFGARYPGNSELFVNSVYWLAGLDELIAASPRTQDIRRIGAMSDGALAAYRTVLLAGLPAGIALAGIGVWFARRRG
ncbi:MAG: hypothetical protein WD316_02760 [Phycisphaeraceae bacterium]